MIISMAFVLSDKYYKLCLILNRRVLLKVSAVAFSLTFNTCPGVFKVPFKSLDLSSKVCSEIGVCVFVSMLACVCT